MFALGLEYWEALTNMEFSLNKTLKFEKGMSYIKSQTAFKGQQYNLRETLSIVSSLAASPEKK